jgi:hypothetical protein
VFERTAQLAEEHAARTFRHVDDATREIELERARHARSCARRARSNANHLRDHPASNR